MHKTLYNISRGHLPTPLPLPAGAHGSLVTLSLHPNGLVIVRYLYRYMYSERKIAVLSTVPQR